MMLMIHSFTDQEILSLFCSSVLLFFFSSFPLLSPVLFSSFSPAFSFPPFSSIIHPFFSLFLFFPSFQSLLSSPLLFYPSLFYSSTLLSLNLSS
ncbi:uncharacterized protein BDW47DRAFT_101007 [Aspergillus candidus]|uniref:Uncharacterized protein n=1 Tax=Aspergillus candidus TaxID=41067 RepID=A0A2I2FJT3_ASPCN|nr:hypothetical protein BDW47DRAFT_101007 [Aspergillus candidus]PLB40881.1 hypothetical protein BDW47DRAFT_101007 [Aspergillus candidus]